MTGLRRAVCRLGRGTGHDDTIVSWADSCILILPPYGNGRALPNNMQGCVCLCMPRTRYFHLTLRLTFWRAIQDPGRPIIIGKYKMPIFVFSDKLSHKNTKSMPSFIYQRHVMEHGSEMRLWPSSRSSLLPLRFGFHTEASLATSLCSFVDLLVPLRLR